MMRCDAMRSGWICGFWVIGLEKDYACKDGQFAFAFLRSIYEFDSFFRFIPVLYHDMFLC